jgi:hypothetical protein
LALDQELVDKIRDLEDLLYLKYLEIFPEDQGVRFPYSSLNEFQQVNWLSAKPDKNIKVFEKKGNKLIESKYEDLPEEADIFPVLKARAWKMDVKQVPQFGISFSVTQLFFRKTESDLKRRKTQISEISIKEYF